jgi:SulP family sulfate permease
VTTLDVHGSLFYAGAKTLEARLPDPADSVSPVVVLRLRGRTTLGATAFSVLAAYGARLAQAGGRLYLSGIDPTLIEQFQQAGRIDASGPVRMYEATEILGDSTSRAYDDAEAWLIGHGSRDP